MHTIGVLALQGDFAEHEATLEVLGAKTVLVKTLDNLKDIDALVIPGGESTVIGMLSDQAGLTRDITHLVTNGLPVLGTCAGIILLADEVKDQKRHGQTNFGGLNVCVSRNFKGSQINSFETSISSKKISPKKIDVMFIRPPQISKTGKNVEVLATYDFGFGESPIAVRQANILATTFHTETSNNLSLHRYFLNDFLD